MFSDHHSSFATRYFILLLTLAAAFVLPHCLNDYLIFILTTLLINGILALSLNLVNGYMGEFSVGHAAFMALGAYSSAIVTVRLLPSLPPCLLFPFAVLIGGFISSLVGVPLAFLSFKTRGDYLAIITLAFLMIVKSGLENISYVGGPRGFLGIPRLTTLPWAFLFSYFLLGKESSSNSSKKRGDDKCNHLSPACRDAHGFCCNFIFTNGFNAATKF